MIIEMWIATTLALTVALVSPILLIPWLRRADVVDVPNERSLHTTATLRGGGLAQACAIVLALGYACVVAIGEATSLILAVVAVSSAAAILGWVEDLRGLPVITRAASQFLIGLTATSVTAFATDHSAWWGIVGGIAVTGGINVVNFMDGVNGISALHGIVAGVSFVVIGLLDNASWLIISGTVLTAAFAAFLPWNLSGKLFLGDVGSYLLGGTIAIIVTIGWMQGLPIIALAAPMTVYITDTSVTLISRIRMKEKWYEAHRDHTYQRLNRSGLSHLGVALIVAASSLITAFAGLGASRTRGVAQISYFAMAVLVIFCYSMLRFKLARSHTSAPRSESYQDQE